MEFEGLRKVLGSGFLLERDEDDFSLVEIHPNLT